LDLSDALSNFKTVKLIAEAMRSLTNYLLQAGCRLRELNLSRNAIGNCILEIKPILSNIETLILCDIGLEGEDAEELFKFLNPSTKKLILCQNNLSEINSLNLLNHLPNL